MKRLKNLFDPYMGLPKEIYVLFLGRVISGIGSFVYPLLALILTNKVGFTKAEAGTFMTILALTQAPSLLFGGKIADTFGRKKTIILFNTLGATSFILCSLFKPSIATVIIIAIASTFYSLTGPAFDAIVGDITNPSNRKGSYSLIYMGFNLGFAVGPIIGGMLFKNHLPLVFIGEGTAALISVILILIFIHETNSRDIKAEIDDSRELEKHQEGSVFSVLIKRPIILYFAVIMFTYQFAYSQWGFTLPLQMGDIFSDLGARYYGMLASFNGIVVIAFTPIITKLLHKMNPIDVIAYGGIFYAFAFGMLGFVKVIPMFFLSVFLMTLGEIMISINNGTFVANHTPASHRGRVSGVLSVITGSGYSLGPMIMGNVLSARGITATWSIISLAVLTGGIFMFVLSRYEKRNA